MNYRYGGGCTGSNTKTNKVITYLVILELYIFMSKTHACVYDTTDKYKDICSIPSSKWFDSHWKKLIILISSPWWQNKARSWVPSTRDVSNTGRTEETECLSTSFHLPTLSYAKYSETIFFAYKYPNFT